MNTQYKQTYDSKQGFTIIEVVLVLAIAALIFLMVFLALPALQRGQRDTARKNDVSVVSAAINSFKSNKKGEIKDMTTNTLKAYVDSLGQYSKDDVAQFAVEGSAITKDTTVNTSTSKISIRKGASCKEVKEPSANAQVVLKKPTSARSVAIITALENNGTPVAHCQDA